MRKAFLFLMLLCAGFTISAITSSFSESGAAAVVAKKKKKKKDKKKKKKKAPKSDCQAKSLARTTADTVILKKYVDLYQGLGGVCYIKKLQDMGELEKTGEGAYTVYLGKTKTPDDRMAWTTYMYCPIGKPDGSVALVMATGDTVQYCTYKNERKEGFMYWLKPRYGIVATFEFRNDERPVATVQEYDPNATPGGGGEPEPTQNRTEE